MIMSTLPLIVFHEFAACEKKKAKLKNELKTPTFHPSITFNAAAQSFAIFPPTIEIQSQTQMQHPHKMSTLCRYELILVVTLSIFT